MACCWAFARTPYEYFNVMSVLPQSSMPKCDCTFNAYHKRTLLLLFLPLHASSAGMMERQKQMTTCAVWMTTNAKSHCTSHNSLLKLYRGENITSSSIDRREAPGELHWARLWGTHSVTMTGNTSSAHNAAYASPGHYIFQSSCSRRLRCNQRRASKVLLTLLLMSY